MYRTTFHLVSIHNHIMEALAKPNTDINEDHDFWAAVFKLKDPYLNICRIFASIIGISLAEFRVIPEDESHATTAKVKNKNFSWKSRTPMSKQQPSEMTMELHFLGHHKKQYMELSNDFDSI